MALRGRFSSMWGPVMVACGLLVLLAGCEPRPQDRILDGLEVIVTRLEQATPDDDPALLGGLVAEIERLQTELGDVPGTLDEGGKKRARTLLERSTRALESLTMAFYSKGVSGNGASGTGTASPQDSD